MDVLFCPQCGNPISNAAQGCPVCGYPFAPAKPPEILQIPFPYDPAGRPSAYPYFYTYKRKMPGKGFGVASLVLGIIGTFYSFVFFLGVTTIYYLQECAAGSPSGNATSGFSLLGLELLIFGILAVIFGIVPISKGHRAAKTKAGIILGGITIFLCLLMIFIGFSGVLAAS